MKKLRDFYKRFYESEWFGVWAPAIAVVLGLAMYWAFHWNGLDVFR